MSTRKVKFPREAVALAVAVGFVGVSLSIGHLTSNDQGGTHTPTAPVSAPTTTSTAGMPVVAVYASDPMQTAASVPSFATLVPNAATMLPISITATCAISTASSAELAVAVQSAAQCLATTDTKTAVSLSLRQAAELSRNNAGAGLILVGDQWFTQPPMTISPDKLADPNARAEAITAAQTAAVTPRLSGSAVTLVPTTAVDANVQAAWTEYLMATGASTGTWL